MSNPLDSDAGTENFDSYDSELRLVLAELNQKNDQISELNGEPRKAAISAAQRAQDEAQELVRPPPSPKHLCLRKQQLTQNLLDLLSARPDAHGP